MSEALGLGEIIITEQQRDAIHIAVVPVRATTGLRPGTPVELDKQGRARKTSIDKAIGVIDPFLNMLPKSDDLVWLYLKPGSITSLRHDWTHPAFASAQEPLAESQLFIDRLAHDCGLTYERLMDGAKDFLENDSLLTDNSQRYDSIETERWDEFWEHYEAITHSQVLPKRRQVFFSCAC